MGDRTIPVGGNDLGIARVLDVMPTPIADGPLTATGSAVTWSLPTADRPLLGTHGFVYRAEGTNGDIDEAGATVTLYDCADVRSSGSRANGAELAWEFGYCFDGQGWWLEGTEGGSRDGIIELTASVPVLAETVVGAEYQWTQTPNKVGILDPPVAQRNGSLWELRGTDQFCMDLPIKGLAKKAAVKVALFLVEVGIILAKDSSETVRILASGLPRACIEMERVRHVWTFTPTGQYSLAVEVSRVNGDGRVFAAHRRWIPISQTEAGQPWNSVATSNRYGSLQVNWGCDVYAEVHSEPLGRPIALSDRQLCARGRRPCSPSGSRPVPRGRRRQGPIEARDLPFGPSMSRYRGPGARCGPHWWLSPSASTPMAQGSAAPAPPSSRTGSSRSPYAPRAGGLSVEWGGLSVDIGVAAVWLAMLGGGIAAVILIARSLQNSERTAAAEGRVAAYQAAAGARAVGSCGGGRCYSYRATSGNLRGVHQYLRGRGAASRRQELVLDGPTVTSPEHGGAALGSSRSCSCGCNRDLRARVHDCRQACWRPCRQLRVPSPPLVGQAASPETEQVTAPP